MKPAFLPVSVIAALAALAIPAAAIPQDAEQRIAWNRPAAPFRIIGNVWYVGTDGLAAYLITDPRGHVLIDGGLPESAPLIAANIRKLGFRVRDVRYLLLNHSHYDHAGGIAALKRASGARLLVSSGDAPDVRAGRTLGRADLAGFPAVAVDGIVRDGTFVRVGATRMTAMLTPGHTRGCTSWTTETAGVRVLFACSLTVAGQRLRGDPAYPDAAADFRATYARLKGVKADVFLNFHPDFFDLKAKRARQVAGDARAFVDPGELARQVADAERGFAAAMATE